MFPLVMLVTEPPGAPVTWLIPMSMSPYIVTLLVPVVLCAMANDETQPSMAADKTRIFFIRSLLLLHEMDGSRQTLRAFQRPRLGAMFQAVKSGNPIFDTLETGENP